MRRRGKVDANQADIVRALRAIGADVQLLSDVGGGVPDLLLGYRGVNILLEVKDGRKPPSERQLTPDQVIWHRDWRGQKAVVESVGEALEAVRQYVGTR